MAADFGRGHAKPAAETAALAASVQLTTDTMTSSRSASPQTPSGTWLRSHVQRQPAHEVGEVVGRRVDLKANCVGSEESARPARPPERYLPLILFQGADRGRWNHI